MQKLIYYIAITSSCLWINCTESDKKAETKAAILPNENHSPDFAENLKSNWPFFSLQIDTSLTYESLYLKCASLDTSDCSGYSNFRKYLGEIENVFVEIKLADYKEERYHLQSGNLKLWVCNLPRGERVKDKILISAYVYNIDGFERAWGFPTILHKVCKK